MGNYPSTAHKGSHKGGVRDKGSLKAGVRDKGSLKAGVRDRSSSNRSKSSNKIRRSKANRKNSASSTTTSATTGTLTDEERSEKIRNGKLYCQNQPIPDDAPAEIKIVRQYLYEKDAHNLDGCRSLTENCYFYFLDAEAEMREEEFYGALKGTYDSFPNLHFFWKGMKTSGTDSKTGGKVVKVKDYYGVGKHTGKPYAFGPYEDIPATGKIVRDENLEFTFIVKDGKIIHATIDADGKVVGPPGFYTKIGGIIPLLEFD